MRNPNQKHCKIALSKKLLQKTAYQKLFRSEEDRVRSYRQTVNGQTISLDESGLQHTRSNSKQRPNELEGLICILNVSKYVEMKALRPLKT